VCILCVEVAQRVPFGGGIAITHGNPHVAKHGGETFKVAEMDGIDENVLAELHSEELVVCTAWIEHVGVLFSTRMADEPLHSGLDLLSTVEAQSEEA